MATNREPIRLKPWPRVVEEEMDRIREELETIAGRLLDQSLVPQDRLALKQERVSLESDFMYLHSELRKPRPQPPARQRREPSIVVVDQVDPLDEEQQMARRAAMMERMLAQVEPAESCPRTVPPLQLALAL